MSVFCLADFHLSNEVDKPMHKFGEKWHLHAEKIRENICNTLEDQDTLLIPGDISWAINWQEVEQDIIFISKLPGKKILLRGNHDYWWGTLSKNYKQLDLLGIKNIDFLQNNAFRIKDPNLGNLLIAGSRGWIFPDDVKWEKKDKRIYQREINRLKISLEKAEALKKDGDRLIVITHFPPMNKQLAISPFTKLMKEHEAEICLYGHIHHDSSPYHIWGEEIQDVPMYLTSCDQINFNPLKVDDYLK